ncbi:hypothetical protein Tco_0468447 [Tanacetum coccineum]
MRTKRRWKEWSKPLRVRALVMTIGLNLPKQILEAQTEALKPENLTAEDVGGVVRFGKRWKLNPRYVSPFKIIERDRTVAYKLELPQQLSRVHNMFHLHFVEEPVEVMDREIKQLKRSRIPLIKVKWNSKRGPEFTLGNERLNSQKYPHLFTKTRTSSSTRRVLSLEDKAH